MIRNLMFFSFLFGINMSLGHAAPSNEATGQQIHQLDEISVEAVSPSLGRVSSLFTTSIERGEGIRSQTSEVDLIARRTNNVAVEDSSVQTRVVMRGMTSIDGGLRDPVGYVVDGVALPLGATQAPDWVNASRIDVVVGSKNRPQGRHAQAGQITVTSEFPSWDSVAWGNYSLRFLDGGRKFQPTNTLLGGVSGAISDNSSVLLALRHQKKESPFYNLADASARQNQSNSTSLSGGWSYFPDHKTDVQLRSHWHRRRGGRATMRYTEGPFATPRFVVNQDTDTDDYKKSTIHSLRVSRSVDSAEVIAVTGVTDYQRNFVMDLDSGPVVTPATRSSLSDRMVSQELRIHSTTADGLFHWSAGGYAYWEQTDSDFAIGIEPSRRDTEIDQWGTALFGGVEYHINERLTLASAVRTEKIRKEGGQRVTGSLSAQYEAVRDDVVVLPKLWVTYQPEPETSLYAALSKGHQPGGYNHTSASDAPSFVYGAEESYSLEFGARETYWDQRVGGELVVFGTLVRDKQVVEFLSGSSRQISNASKAEIVGVEHRVDARFSENLRLDGIAGWQKAVLADAGQTGRNRNDLPYSPAFTATMNLDFQYSLAWQVRMSARYTDSFYFDAENTLTQPGYLTAAIEARYSRGGLTLSFAAQGSPQQKIFTRAVSTPSGTLVEDGSPRRISFHLGYEL